MDDEPERNPRPGPDAEEFAALLVGVQRLTRRHLRAGLDRPRLRGAQAELLRLVADAPGMRVSEAAEELSLAGNSVSTLVNQLVGQGLLRRETDPADRRAALLYATGEAVERLAAWRLRRAELLGEVLAELDGADRAALAAALPALRAVAAGLRARGSGEGKAEA
ncbi:MarR family winged helix-turn-helix transcriptional regulator [Kitasatospora phosalacinea]|uniref:MarR family winged helix-turn-helix transcriptional regulator n=1 Tax=Kitasatospora phosalacinea TaxID=2065 RepID=UPI0006912AD3|nr:MarR family transcriptional regulator [Kitasatospora phosalacinea]